jgi:hypothetical protein
MFWFCIYKISKTKYTLSLITLTLILLYNDLKGYFHIFHPIFFLVKMLQKYPPINWALLIFFTFISQHVSTLNRVLSRWVYILNWLKQSHNKTINLFFFNVWIKIIINFGHFCYTHIFLCAPFGYLYFLSFSINQWTRIGCKNWSIWHHFHLALDEIWTHDLTIVSRDC